MQELQAFVVKEYKPFIRVVVQNSEHFEIYCCTVMRAASDVMDAAAVVS